MHSYMFTHSQFNHLFGNFMTDDRTASYAHRGAGTGGAEGAAAPPVFSVGNCKLL